jgi:hypothetical protein
MSFLARCVLLISIAFLTACLPSTIAVPSTRCKFFIAADGFYRVTSAELQTAGIAIDTIDAATLQLYRGDQPVAIRVQGAGKNLTLDFYARAGDSPHSAFTIYWLTWDAQPGMRMREIVLPEIDAPPSTAVESSIRFAPARVYAPQPGDAAPSWFWQTLDAPITATIPITLPDALPGFARLRVNVWGNTPGAHHLRVEFNDARGADEFWEGRGAHEFEIAIEPRAEVNTLQLRAPGDPRALADVILLSSLEITYTRRLLAQNDQLEFETRAGNFRVAGFRGGAIELYDITAPDEPQRVANAIITPGAITFRTDDPGARRWLTLDPSTARRVSKIAPMPLTNLRARENQADYLILAHPDLATAAQPLAQWRAQRGLATRVITTEEIYDEFNFGAASPDAIRVFLDFAQREWRAPAPRFVLLLGKASYDTRDVLNAPNKNLVPTFLVDTLNAEKIASEHAFVARAENDPRPVIALGRIPAQTPDQVARVVRKIIAYETGAPADWRARALLVADDKSPEFVAMADTLAGQLPAHIHAQKIYLAELGGDVKRARAELIARWNAGAGALVYIGHGAVDTWAAGPLFSAAHLGALKNDDRLPIVFTPTCLDGFFNHPRADSLVEELLFKADGGTVAGIAPTGVSFADAQGELMRALFAELFHAPRPTLGEALARAKQKLAPGSRAQREVIATFVLLGDPALAPR